MSIANPLVLIADDDPDIRMLVRLRLERSGYTVIAANDGLEALELAAGCDPDLAILDVSMPGLSGVEVTRALRERQATFPVILLTAHAREPTRLSVQTACIRRCERCSTAQKNRFIGGAWRIEVSFRRTC